MSDHSMNRKFIVFPLESKGLQFGWLTAQSSHFRISRLKDHNDVASLYNIEPRQLEELAIRLATEEEIKTNILDPLRRNIMCFEYHDNGVRPDTGEDVRPSLDAPLMDSTWSLLNATLAPSPLQSTLTVSKEAWQVSVRVPKVADPKKEITEAITDVLRDSVKLAFHNCGGKLSFLREDAAMVIEVYGNADFAFKMESGWHAPSVTEENKGKTSDLFRDMAKLGFNHTIEYHVDQLIQNGLADKALLPLVRAFIAAIPRDRLYR